MKRLPVVLGAALSITLSACGGGSSASSAGSSAAPAASQAPAAQATVAATTAADNAAPAALPIYPGAVKSTAQMATSFTACGHKMTMTLYRVADANADKVGDWYAGQMAGSTEMKNDINAGTNSIHHVMMHNPDGTAGASIVDMPKLPPSLAKYASRMPASARGTQLAIATYDPGFDAADQALFKAAFSGDAAAKAAATAQLKAKCGTDFKFGG